MLSPCINPFNCFFVEKKFEDPEITFKKLVSIAELLPRTKVLKKNEIYWHGICKSLIFRFPDDLEILKLNNKIQIKSSSRYGGSDFGVNKRRINKLLQNRV